MSIHKLSFGEIIILKPNLAEVIIDSDVVMDLEMVGEYHGLLLNPHTSEITITQTNIYECSN